MQEYPVNAIFLHTSFLVLHFSDCTLMTFLIMLSVILLTIYTDNSTLYSKHSHSEYASDLWQQLELASESDLRAIVDWGRKWLVDLNPGKTQLVLLDRSNNSGTFDMKMYASVLEKTRLLRCCDCLSLLNWIGTFILSPLLKKIASKKIGALIRCIKFLSPGCVIYLYKSIIHPS